jgi:polyhydroxybutyrate depolymerase
MASDWHELTFSHDGRERSAVVQVPAEGGPRPLALMLHGGGGSGRRFAEVTRFGPVAEREGLVAVYPDAVEGTWNDGRSGVNHVSHRDDVDDLGFLMACVERAADMAEVDRRRVCVAGASNGGMMAFRLLHHHAEAFAAAAVAMATLPASCTDWPKPAAPVPMMLIFGTEDPIMPIDGGTVMVQRQELGEVRSLADTVAWWAGVNGCDPTPEERTLLEEDGMRLVERRYGSAEDALRLYLVEGGGHTWPGGQQYLAEWVIGKTLQGWSASDAAAAFFLGHSR